MTDTLATKDKDTELATPTAELPMLDGATAEDLKMPLLHLFTDTGTESDNWGSHNKGDIVCSLDTSKPFFTPGDLKGATDYTMEIDLLPVSGWIEYEARDDDGRILYMTRDIKEVPKEDMEPGSGKDGAGTRCKRHVVWAFMYKDAFMPAVIRFKSYSEKTGQTIHTLQTAYTKAGMRPQTFKVSPVLKTNPKGKFWIWGRVAPSGDAPTELIKAAKPWMNRQLKSVDEPVVDSTIDVEFEEAPPF